MEPNCPRCKSEEFNFMLDDAKVHLFENDSEFRVDFVWVYCKKCGCVVGLLKENEPSFTRRH